MAFKKNNGSMEEIFGMLNLVREKIKEDYPSKLKSKNNHQILEYSNLESSPGKFDYSCLFLGKPEYSLYESIKMSNQDMGDIFVLWDWDFNFNLEKFSENPVLDLESLRKNKPDLISELIKKVFCAPLILAPGKTSKKNIELGNHSWVSKIIMGPSHQGFNINYSLDIADSQKETLRNIDFSGRIWSKTKN